MPSAQPIRRFVSPAHDLTELADIDAAYARLADRELVDADDLSIWLREWSELESLLDEDFTRRGIAIAVTTDDPGLHAAYLDFVDRIAPHCKPRRHALTRRLLAHPRLHDLGPDHHALIQQLAERALLHRDDAAALEVEEHHLLAEVARLRSGVVLTWDGAPSSVELVEAALDHPDPGRREAAWRLLDARFAADRAAHDALFDRLLAVRQSQAGAAGCVDIRAHRFRLLGRRDYGVDDCLGLHAAIAREVVPFAADLLASRRRRLGLATTRPWDLTAPLARADTTRPFHDERTLVDGITHAITRVDPELGEQFAALARDGLLDLLARPGKSPGAWQADLPASGRPFVFTNAVGRREDLWTVLHEAGHALHAIASADDPHLWTRAAPQEFAELAGTALELLGGCHLGAFFDESASRAARREQLVQTVLSLPHIACVDQFQHTIYTAPMTAAWDAARDATWHDCHARFFPTVDWSGPGLCRGRQWHRQVHIFTAPFYFIEYAIAQLAALELLERYLEDPRTTVAAYRRALALGGRAGLRDLLAAAGLDLDLTAPYVARRMEFVRRELTRLA